MYIDRRFYMFFPTRERINRREAVVDATVQRELEREARASPSFGIDFHLG